MASKKIHSLEPTPLMMLSMLALFIMMPTIVVLSNNNRQVRRSAAAQPVQSATPTPTPLTY